MEETTHLRIYLKSGQVIDLQADLGPEAEDLEPEELAEKLIADLSASTTARSMQQFGHVGVRIYDVTGIEVLG